MTYWWFPDNTVLCNFAAVRRTDVLEKTLANRGRWTEAVASEANQSAQVMPGLEPILQGGWLGEPIEISGDAEVHGIEVIRRTVFGGAAAQPRKHLGEAQTLYLLTNRSEFSSSVWITDDREAFIYAKGRGIITRDTVEVIRHAIADGIVTAGDGFGLLQSMVAAGRSLWNMPRGPDELRR